LISIAEPSDLLGMDGRQEAVVSLPSGFRMPGKPDISKSQILPGPNRMTSDGIRSD
jgi:hypothetical protein